MRTRTWLAAGLAVGGLVEPRPAAGQSAPVVVALSAAAAPGGGTYTGFTDFPVVNNSGQVAFTGLLSASAGSNSGVFVGAPGSVQAAARQGDAIPDFGTYGDLSFVSPVLNDAGRVAFAGRTNTSEFTDAIFAGPAGTVQAVARLAGFAPGGGLFSTFGFGVPRLNGAGQVTFAAGVNNSGSTSGLFVSTPGSVNAAAIARSNQPSPAGPNYGNLADSGALLNASGRVAFAASIGANPAPSSALFAGVPGSLQTVAVRGGTAPTGDTYTGSFGVALNAAGRVAFLAGLSAPGSGGAENATGIFVQTPTGLQTVARTGGTAPGGGVFGPFFGVSGVVLNGAGQVAFESTLTDAGGTAAGRGVFVGAPGGLQAAARSGTTAPGGGTFDSFGGPSLNGSGQVAFTATLSGAGVVAGNDRGLYAGPAGGVVKVVREGDVVDVDPGAGLDPRVVADNGIRFTFFQSGGEDGGQVVLSDAGFVTYGLVFTDGTSGVFVSQLTPVPEPATVGLAAAAGLTGAGWVRRRSRRHAT